MKKRKMYKYFLQRDKKKRCFSVNCYSQHGEPTQWLCSWRSNIWADVQEDGSLLFSKVKESSIKATLSPMKEDLKLGFPESYQLFQDHQYGESLTWHHWEAGSKETK